MRLADHLNRGDSGRTASAPFAALALVVVAAATGVLITLTGLTLVPISWRWWWLQGACATLGLAAIGVMTLNHRHAPTRSP